MIIYFRNILNLYKLISSKVSLSVCDAKVSVNTDILKYKHSCKLILIKNISFNNFFLIKVFLNFNFFSRSLIRLYRINK